MIIRNSINSEQVSSRVNDVIYAIHKDISADHNAKTLAKIAAYSEQHFHRVFKSVVGETLHGYITRIRMEYAANQLMFEPSLTVLEVANRCGFSSPSSFSRAFKSVFQVSPGQWCETRNSDKPYLSDPEIAKCYEKLNVSDIPKVSLVECEPIRVAYIRHKGYGRAIRQTWLKLNSWAKQDGRVNSRQFGLHHSNPVWTSLDECRYVACIEINHPLSRRGAVNEMFIPGGLYAKFHITGHYGELLPNISLIQEHWLPQSGMKMRSTPGYVEYKKNHFIEEDENFELDFYLPIGFF